MRGQEYSYAVDWWGLGCILFECLLGRVPFRKNDEEPPASYLSPLGLNKANDTSKFCIIEYYTSHGIECLMNPNIRRGGDLSGSWMLLPRDSWMR